MPRRYNIKWRQVDEQKLQRTVRNYNAKRRRLINIDPDNESILPAKLSIKQVRESIATRADFNRTINRIKRFSRRGSEQVINVNGTDITKYEYTELRRSIRRLNNINAKERQVIENQLLKSRGQPVGYTVGMGDITISNLRERNLNIKNKSRRELDRYFDRINLQASDKYQRAKRELYKENYLKAFEKVFNGLPYFESVFETIKQLSHDTFVNVLETDLEGDIYFIYDDYERLYKFSQLIGVWKEFIDTETLSSVYGTLS